MTEIPAPSPKISIIIPSFNQGQFLAQAISSVLYQDYANVELIVIDGGSTDYTREVMARYADAIYYAVSESDRGQAHAINKGFQVATGDILGWLNSDDMYLPCTLSKIAALLGTASRPALVYGGCMRFTQGTSHTHGVFPPEFDREYLRYFDYIDQPSTFWTRSLWEAAGELDERYHYVLDWDWYLRASRFCDFIPIKEFLSIYRYHEEHKTGSGGAQRRAEILHLIETYASDDWIAAYREAYAQFRQLKRGLNVLHKWKLHRLRFFMYPHLYLKHGKRKIDLVVYGGGEI